MKCHPCTPKEKQQTEVRCACAAPPEYGKHCTHAVAPQHEAQSTGTPLARPQVVKNAWLWEDNWAVVGGKLPVKKRFPGFRTVRKKRASMDQQCKHWGTAVCVCVCMIFKQVGTNLFRAQSLHLAIALMLTERLCAYRERLSARRRARRRSATNMRSERI